MTTTGNFEGKTVAVTGATSGIGFHTALAFASRGAFVIGGGRSQARCDSALAAIQAACPEAQARYLLADLSLQDQVRGLAEGVSSELQRAGYDHLDVLVNNAGIYSGKFIKTADGVEKTLAVNHLAPFLLTHQLLGLLKGAASGRVITISSGSHYGTRLEVKNLNRRFLYIGLRAYSVSKLANVLFTLEFNRRAAGTNIRAFAVDPGLVNTEIGLKGTDLLSRLVWRMRSSSGVQPEVPVQTILFLANHPDSQEIYWYDCKPKTPSSQAQREDLAQELWQASCRMCGIEWE